MGSVTHVILQDSIVNNIQGTAYLIDADGRQVILAAGDALISGQTILLTDGSSVGVMQDGSLFVIEGTAPPQDQLIAEEFQDVDEGVDLESLADIELIQQAILAGEDPNAVDDAAPAAGPEAGGGTQTATPVIDRTGAETIATAGFDTTSASGANQAEDTDDTYFQPSPIVSLSSSQVSVTEGGTAVFTVNLDQATDQDITVNLTYSGTADDGSDYTGIASVIVPAGATSVDLDIITLDDGIYENLESFTVTIDSVIGSGATIDPLNNSADTDILDAQEAPAVSIVADQESVLEGVIAGFTVSVDQIADEAVTVNFTYSGTAEDGSDFTGIGSTIIPAGESSVDLDISTINDGIYEGAEAFTVTISGVTGADATISAVNSASTGILDAQEAPAVGIVADQESVLEGVTAGFTVSIDQIADEAVTVNFTYSGTAEDGSDFTGVGSTIIPAGESSVDLDISTINDGIYEGAEAFTVTISGVTGADATISAVNSAGTGILDAQEPPAVGIVADQESVLEGVTAGFTVSIDQIADEAVTVNFTYSGTAEDGSDFTGVGSTIIPAGESSVDLDISTINDGIYEGAEAFTVTISGVTGADATISAVNSASTGILDAQEPPAVGIVADQESVLEGVTAGFTVSIDQIADEAVTVNFTYSGTAEDGSDFTGVGSTIIPAGESSVDLDISTLDDAFYEGDESFTVTISSVAGADATISATNSASTGIEDNEHPPIAVDDGDEGDAVFLGTRAEDGTLNDWSTGTENEDGSVTYKTHGDHTVVVSATTDVDRLISGDITFVDTDFDDQHGVGIGVAGHDDQIDYDEIITINFGGVVSGDTEIGLTGLGGHFIAGSKYDAKATWTAYDVEGNIVKTGSIQQDDDTTPMTNSFTVGVDFSYIEFSVASTGSSNFVIQYVKAIYVDDSAYVADEDAVLHVDGVLDNDSDPDSDPLTVIEMNGEVTAIGTATDLASGAQVTMQSDGSFDYNPNGKYDYLAEGEIATDTFTYTISDGTGGTDSATVTITIIGTNDAPSVKIEAARVSEEGLTGAIPDNFGTPDDLTDDESFTGEMTITDAEDDAVTITLTPPTTAITSDGVALVWDGENTDTLTGSVNGNDIITIEIISNTEYKVTLSGPIDHLDPSTEDVLSFNVGVNVSDGIDITTEPLKIYVEDDSPEATPIEQTVLLETQDTNIMLMLDVSGSMDGDRLSIMKQSVTELIQEYDNLGDVMVRVITFNNQAHAYTDEWVSAEDAIAYVDGISDVGGATNYDKSLLKAMDVFDDFGKIEGAVNVSYFLSDGEPTSNADWNYYGYSGSLPKDDGIQSAEESLWVNFLTTKTINSFAYGMGADVVAAELEPIAYDGITGQDPGAIVVADINELPPILRDSIVTPITDSLVTGNLGADGGDLGSFTIDGVTYSMTDSGDALVVVGSSAGEFDSVEKTWTVRAESGGKLVVDMDDGTYTYTSPASAPNSFDEVIDYTLKDNDGDTASSTLTINVKVPTVLSSTLTAIDAEDLGFSGEYYGYNEEVPHFGYWWPGKINHTDDGSVGNLDNLAEVGTIIEGRAGSNIVGTTTAASDSATDAKFVAQDLDFALSNLRGLGDNWIAASGEELNLNDNLYHFLIGVDSNNVGKIIATSGVGDTTDAIIRMMASISLDAGNYDFRVTSDDGYLITVGGKEVAVFNSNAYGGPQTNTFTNVSLDDGFLPIEVLYWDQGGYASFKVEVKLTGEDDSAYQILGTDEMPIFVPDAEPSLNEQQDLVDSGENEWSIRTGATYDGDATDNYVRGSDGKDVIRGNDGDDVLYGEENDDVIDGGAGNDVLVGGSGNDRLIGGDDADVFRWVADDTTTDTAQVDTVEDFSIAEGDKLDLSDVLDGVTADNINQYLTVEFDGNDTIITADTNGQLNAGGDTVTIVLEGWNNAQGDWDAALNLTPGSVTEDNLAELLKDNDNLDVIDG